MKKLLWLWVLFFILFGFYQVNELNYKKHLQIRDNLVNHPEWLPKKEVAVNTSFWFRNLRADFYRLQTIQYIWWNVIWSEYKKYLFAMLDLITELNPSFEHPYIIWQLLLPEYNYRYEKLDKSEQKKNVDQAEMLWLKWVANFCDPVKVEMIKKEDDLRKIWKDPKYRNPCKWYSIPYYLAYIYYFNKKNPLESSAYYKVASANDDSVEWAKTMAAIMQWKWWNRAKSYMMFLNLAKILNDKKWNCVDFSNYLENVWASVFYKLPDKDWNILKLDGNLVKFLQESREKVFWKFEEKKEDKLLSDTECINYANKAIRELNLAYIEKWNEKYKETHSWSSARNAKILFNEKYIDFLPTDFQQYKTYGIIYEYNDEIKWFDYEMGNY
jgi:hypothetical protein